MQLITPSKTYDLTSRTHVMGILNTTPDSFSDGGKYATIDQAVAESIRMESLGADIIDVGGESTRPNHQPVSLGKELNRVIPAIKAIKEKVSVPISIDTYKAETARQALAAGAEMINDIWGAKKDPEIAAVAAEYQAPIILMHNRTNMDYTSLIDNIKADLYESVDIALKQGVKQDKIIIDPGIGIGFAKTVQDNITVMNQLQEFTTLGYPLLLGTSRKSFIGEILNIPADQRDNGTGATTCLGITKGVHIIRVHDVKLHVELTKMMDVMMRGSI